jgi:hypothetical protein
MKFLFYCLLCGLSAVASALDREAFTITQYDLQVRLEPDQQRLGSRGKIVLRNDSQLPQKIVALQLSSSLDWRSIRINGKPVQFVAQPFASDIDHTGALSEAIVTLPAEVTPKDSVEIEIGYEGLIPLDATRLTSVGVPDAIAKHSSWDQIGTTFTAVRGAGYVAWYPITTAAADFSEGNSLFEVVDRWRSREAASEFKAAISIAGADQAGPPQLLCGAQGGWPAEFGRVRGDLSICNSKQLGNSTPTFAIGKYIVVTDPPLRLFSLAGHESGASTYANALEPASKFVAAWFGSATAPIAVADFADPNSAPFESGTLLMASMADEDSKLAGTNLVHELVHSAVPSTRPWVYEGLAHFAEALYRQQQGGREAALDLLGLHSAAFLDAEKELSGGSKGTSAAQSDAPSPVASAPVGQPLATTFDESFYRTKAAYVWWMLRDMIGDDALKQIVRSYHADDDKDPNYIERLVAAASKRDLGWFFNDWVYRDRGLPDLRVKAAHPWSENGSRFVTVTLENLGGAGAEVPFTIAYEGGEIKQRIEVHAKGTVTTRVLVMGTPTEIVVNDGSVPESDLTHNVYKIPAE